MRKKEEEILSKIDKGLLSYKDINIEKIRAVEGQQYEKAAMLRDIERVYLLHDGPKEILSKINKGIFKYPVIKSEKEKAINNKQYTEFDRFHEIEMVFIIHQDKIIYKRHVLLEKFQS